MAKSGSTFLALLTGAAIGAGLGMLYAPESGENTRKKLGENAKRTQDDLNKRYRETSSNLSQKAKKAKSDFEQRLEETLSSASFKADEILSSLELKLEELKKQNSKFQKDRKSESGDKANVDESVASKGNKNTGSAAV
ncbi:YtxH domain-containing protein [Salinimicrobium sp. TH3]|uniref:YtxH domain-containing protein n=1 Tax=Salinimicrobium sp. TH3 TaxID=2997342 RepID=UPI0022742C24|nr:YtxH domain-containing protein [Salinimicrobium sp. TH3]MCY2686523.1 YtxH domain-containing protein [Salinimicrobium sp. TH3]